MNPITKLEIYAAVLLLLAGATTGAYFYAKHQGVMEERGRWEVKEAVATKADLDGLKQAVADSNQIARDVRDAFAAKGQQKVIDRGVIEHVIKENTVYSTECFDAAGLRAYNDISAGRALVPSSSTGLGNPQAVSQGLRAPGGR